MENNSNIIELDNFVFAPKNVIEDIQEYQFLDMAIELLKTKIREFRTGPVTRRIIDKACENKERMADLIESAHRLFAEDDYFLLLYKVFKARKRRLSQGMGLSQEYWHPEESLGSRIAGRVSFTGWMSKMREVYPFLHQTSHLLVA